jgi:thiamine pyrophosphokinase
MGPVRGLVSEGLRWPVAGLALSPDRRIGTSNVALGGPVRVGFDAPRVLVILPETELGQVAARIRDA